MVWILYPKQGRNRGGRFFLPARKTARNPIIRRRRAGLSPCRRHALGAVEHKVMIIYCRVCGCEITKENERVAVVNRRGKTFRRTFHICRPCGRAEGRARKAAEPEKYKAWYAAWVGRNREHVLNYQREYRKNNPEKCRALKQSWRDRNRDNYRKLARDYYWRHRDDPWYVVCRRTRARLAIAISHAGTRKYKNTMQLVGCDRDALVKHIESQFIHGMSWDNRGLWHIDHIIPCSAFDLA